MKKMIKESVDGLSQKAVQCADLAKAQRQSANRQQAGAYQQHTEAHKLEKLGDELKKDVAEIREKLATASDDGTKD